MAAFKIGDHVKIKFSTMEGDVIGAALDEETLDVQFFVEYVDKYAEAQTRYFSEADLELV